MKKFVSVVAMLALVAVSLVTFSTNASAAELKMVGVITKIEMSADKKAATVTLKDSKSSELVVVEVKDELTVDKFNDKRVVVGDEVRCKYNVVDGKNVARLFKKTAGC
jgi:P pilus assembly chaperone PapD